MAPTLAPHIHWAERLEYVLDDGDALQVFLNFLKNDPNLSEHPVYLHFSVIAYKNKCFSNDPRTCELAEQIYNKFLRPQGGLCAFIPDAVREGIGARVKSLQCAPDPAVFDTCLPYVDAYLRKQHALFVRSEEFLEFVNTMSASCYSDTGVLPVASTSTPSTSRFGPSTSSTMGPPRPPKKDRRSHGDTPKLTAEILMKTQFDRENTLGKSHVEKMFEQTIKYPYVPQATTSKNDSAVSSSFSSDANRSRGAHSRHQLAVLKEEHRRENPITTIMPRPERTELGDKWDHSSEDGRKSFADLLIKKLNKVSSQRKHSDAMNEQLKEIEKKKFSARDVIKQNATSGLSADVDDDDDVENYVKQKMVDDSMKPSPSQHSPTIPLSMRSRRRSPKSTSPERIPYYPPQQPAMPPMMTQSCMNPYGLNGFAPPPAAALGCPSRSYRQGAQGYPYGFSPTPGAIPGFAKSPYQQQQAYPQPQGYSVGQYPQNIGQTHSQNPFKYTDGDCDTSGIGSMTTTLLSSTPSIQEKTKAKLFQKAREMYFGDQGQVQSPGQGLNAAPPSMANRTIEASERPLFPTTTNTMAGTGQQKKRAYDFSSLPRLKTSSGRSPDFMTLTYKEDGVPIVAHVPKTTSMTLKEFRRHLSISSKPKKQFFFKSPCEDGSSPYMLLLINDDSATVPIFEGKIYAEVKTNRSPSDSE